ncbi:hypothetical protein GQ457_09G026880 [Hibiscus cannabinus]
MSHMRKKVPKRFFAPHWTGLEDHQTRPDRGSLEEGPMDFTLLQRPSSPEDPTASIPFRLNSDLSHLGSYGSPISPISPIPFFSFFRQPFPFWNFV